MMQFDLRSAKLVTYTTMPPARNECSLRILWRKRHGVPSISKNSSKSAAHGEELIRLLAARAHVKNSVLDRAKPIKHNWSTMNRYSTRQAAKELGIAHNTLAHYMAVGKLPKPEGEIAGIRPTHIWTKEEIENVRKLLPKIANGRKTRYLKVREKQKAQPGAAVPHKARKSKKK
jgi:hypothetical protein